MQQSEEIRRAGIAIYDALNQHDAAAVAQYFDSGPSHLSVGTAADEVWQGGDVVVKNFEEQFRQMPELRFTAGDIVAYADGDTGWLFDQPTVSGPGMPATTARLTAVFHRQGAEWKVAHSHLSLPS